MRPHASLMPVLLLALAVLGGCKTTGGDIGDSFRGKYKEREARRSTAAAAAMAEGRTGDALAKYAALHEDHPRDRDIAVNYAQLLRKTGDPGAAKAVLEPLLSGAGQKGPWQEPSPVLRNEYAAALIALGDYARAEELLNEVLADDKAVDVHHDAQDLMGVALDARGRHKEAEVMFRAALDGWKGDPSPVMNNLGLCLAARGKFDEALLTLRQALVMAPDKEEIARNIEIVSSLRERIVRKPGKS